jgi:polysaccharide transporter, PST family
VRRLIVIKNIPENRINPLFNTILEFPKITEEKRVVIKNFIALAILQGTNFLLPLITLPYLIRTIGPDKFGLVSVAQAFHTYFILFTDYGFNLSATREISLHRNDKEKLSSIFSEVLICKIFLSLISLVIVIIIVECVNEFRQHRLLMYLSFSMVIGQVLLPVWFFQGIEKMKFLTYLNIFGKTILLVLVFLLVNDKEDHVFVPLLFASANIFSGIIAIFIVLKKFEIDFRFPLLKDIKTQLSEGWHTFISIFSIGIYVYINVFILSFFVDEESVGFYSISEKIAIAVWQIPAIFSQATYPFLCSLTKKGFSQIVDIFRKVYFPFCVFMFFVSLLIFIYSDFIIEIVSGKSYPEAVMILKILSFVPFTVTLNVPAYQVLLAYNFKSSYTFVFTFFALINILLNLLLAYSFSSYGTAFCVFITQLMITVSLYLVLEFKHKEYSLLQHFFKR